MCVICNLNVLDHLFVDYHLAPVIAGQIMGTMISILFIWSFLVWKRYKSDNALSKLVSKVGRLDYMTIKEWFIRNRYDCPPNCKYMIAYASPEMLSFLGIDNRSQIVSEKDVIMFLFEKGHLLVSNQGFSLMSRLNQKQLVSLKKTRAQWRLIYLMNYK